MVLLYTYTGLMMSKSRKKELFEYTSSGDISGVMTLLEQRIVDVNATNVLNETALYIACENGHTAVAQYLLDNGADVSCGRTKPLIAAVRYGHYDCVKLLLEYHADANCSSGGETPMSVALQKHPSDIELILLLVQYDAITSESFDDDIAVELLNHAKTEHSREILKLMDGNYQLDGGEHISGGI